MTYSNNRKFYEAIIKASIEAARELENIWKHGSITADELEKMTGEIISKTAALLQTL